MTVLLGRAPAPALSRTCRGCGCTDSRACVTDAGPCAWAVMDIDSPSGVCTVCADRLRWHWGLLATVGWDPDGFAAAVEAMEGEALRELHASAVLQRGAA